MADATAPFAFVVVLVFLILIQFHRTSASHLGLPPIGYYRITAMFQQGYGVDLYGPLMYAIRLKQGRHFSILESAGLSVGKLRELLNKKYLFHRCKECRGWIEHIPGKKQCSCPRPIVEPLEFQCHFYAMNVQADSADQLYSGKPNIIWSYLPFNDDRFRDHVGSHGFWTENIRFNIKTQVIHGPILSPNGKMLLWGMAPMNNEARLFEIPPNLETIMTDMQSKTVDLPNYVEMQTKLKSEQQRRESSDHSFQRSEKELQMEHTRADKAEFERDRHFGPFPEVAAQVKLPESKFWRSVLLAFGIFVILYLVAPNGAVIGGATLDRTQLGAAFAILGFIGYHILRGQFAWSKL